MIKHLLMAMLAFNFLYESKAVEFSVETIDDQLSFESVLSDDGKVYTDKGGRQVGIYQWIQKQGEWRGTIKRLGGICCHTDGQYSNEYFIYAANGEKKLLQTKIMEIKEQQYTSLTIYQLNGNKTREIKIKSEMPYQFLSVSRRKKHIGVYDGNDVIIYNDKLDEVNRYRFNEKMLEPKIFKIANGGNSFVLGGKSGLLYGDIAQSKSNYVKGCPKIDNRLTKWADVVLNSFEENSDSYLVVSGDFGCVLDEKIGSEFTLKRGGRKLGVYADANYLYVVRNDKLQVFSTTKMEFLDEFEVIPYYRKNISRDPYENPFFVSHEYDNTSKTFFLGGSGTIGTLFKLRVILPQPIK